MSAWYVPRYRGETLLAVLRVAVALLTALALRLDPSLWVIHRDVSWIGIAYGIYAAVTLVMAFRLVPTPRRRLQLQIADLVFTLLLIVVAHRAPTVVISNYVFVLGAAAIRFRPSTIVWSAALCIAAYVNAIVLADGYDSFELVALNVLQLTIIAGVGVSLTSYRERLRMQVTEVLEAHSDDGSGEPDQTFVRAARAIGAPRAVLLLFAPEGTSLRYYSNGQVHVDGGSAGEWARALDPTLEEVDFYSNDLGSGIVVTSGGETMRLAEPISSSIASDFGVETLLRIAMQGALTRGSIFFLDRAFTFDDLGLGRLASEAVAARYDDAERLKRASREAVALDRFRIARDLHDGLLQSLTGATLQIEAVRRVMKERPDEAMQSLREIQDVLLVDQHEVRFMIDSLRQTPRASTGDVVSEVRFYALAAIVRRQWGAELDVRLDPLGPNLSKAFRREVHRLVREAVFNAAKHSGASRIVVEGGTAGDVVRLLIKDDGRGFPFVGRFDLDKLNEMKAGPTTLKERVSAMGGELTIVSSNHGSEVEIRIPTAAGAAA